MTELGGGGGAFEDPDGDGVYTPVSGLSGIDGPVIPSHNVSWQTELISEPSTLSGFTDPLVFHPDHFSNDKYRVIAYDSGNTDRKLYTTSDPTDDSTYTFSQNILTGQGSSTPADGFVKSDGTFVVYLSTGSGSNMDVFTGSSLTSLSRVGQAVAEPDGGVYHEASANTVHIYTEDQDNVSGESSDKISHFTTPDDDLTNDTQQSDAIDATSTSWATGDPTVRKVFNTYYMFFDVTMNHPDYRIGVARSTDLDNWSIVSTNITGSVHGGDMDTTRNGNHFNGFTEFTGGDNSGIGVWEMVPAPAILNENFAIYDRDQGEYRAKHHTTSNLAFLDWLHNSGKNWTGFRLVKADDTEVLRMAQFDGQPVLLTKDGQTIQVNINDNGPHADFKDGEFNLRSGTTLSLNDHPEFKDTNRQTLSGDLTLSATDAHIQNIDPGGAARTVTLPAESNGLEFIIGNRADAAESLTVNDDSGTTIATVNQDDVGRFISDGTGWIGFVGAGGVT